MAACYTGIIDEALVFNDHVSADDVNALYLAAPSYDGNSEPELEAKAEVKPKPKARSQGDYCSLESIQHSQLIHRRTPLQL